MQKLIRTSLTLALLAACGTSETASDDEAPPVAKPDNTPAVPVAEPTDAIEDGNNEAANTPTGEGLEFDSKQVAMDQEARSASCETLTRSYSELRKTTNHCKQDSDCAEMPGNCAMGPYYINRYEDVVKLEITEAAYNSKCAQQQECGGQALGTAVCENQVCVSSGTEPAIAMGEENECQSQPVVYSATNGTNYIATSKTAAGQMMLNVISFESAGTLNLDATWPENCNNCELHLVSKKDAGLTNLLKVTKKSDEGALMTANLAAGDYRYIAISSSAEPQYISMNQTLKDDKGAPIRAKSRGLVWEKWCQ